MFLDRDGTLIVETNYLSNPADVVFIPGVFDAVGRLRQAGFRIVVVTNQAGMARGYYGLDDYRAVEAHVETAFRDNGAPIDGTWFCPHHPEFTGPCACRKPGTGMYRQAAEALGIDLAASYYVGDKLSDVHPSADLGGWGILVRTGYGREEEANAGPEVTVVSDVSAAADWILQHRSR